MTGSFLGEQPYIRLPDEPLESATSGRPTYSQLFTLSSNELFSTVYTSERFGSKYVPDNTGPSNEPLLVDRSLVNWLEPLNGWVLVAFWTPVQEREKCMSEAENKEHHPWSEKDSGTSVGEQ